ncbi:AraC family transcriptional regulator [Actomonas aquatica]|uniref:AraC family transcriptional regulator n=1 Tax=Actomonas aquatica TaxID=2866162 RepID=A0ABZ1C4Z5_9BACT|nr:AraC family transcriptional regulator [Opitutus sp. WL0086]WRQ86725.1 AraC family transcriptional regulator [Opitutus sp. WL0086]
MDRDAALKTIRQTVDPLGEALHSLHMSGTFYCRSELTAPWGVDLPAMPHCLMFHVVSQGEAWVTVPDADPCHLSAGDIALLPHGEGHQLTHAIGAPSVDLFDLPREELGDRYERIITGGGGAVTNLICGAVTFSHPVAQQVIGMLPKLMNLRASVPGNAWIHDSLRFITAEAENLRPGGDTIITRFSDILVIQAIRAWIDHDPSAQQGWLGALRDPQIGRAIAMVHRDPVRDWNLQSLADTAAMSRSAFAAAFQEKVGETPMHYVRRWRMGLAESWLREGQATVAEIADRLGYQSEAAFSRAFKSMRGVSPGSLRKGANATATAPTGK